MTDKFLPDAQISRIAKSAADNRIISKDTRNALNRSTAAFLLFLSGATEDILKKKKKTVGEVEMYEALRAIDFGDYALAIQQGDSIRNTNNINHGQSMDSVIEPGEDVNGFDVIMDDAHTQNDDDLILETPQVESLIETSETIDALADLENPFTN